MRPVRTGSPFEEHLVDDGEAVAAAQVFVEIDVGREDSASWPATLSVRPAASVAAKSEFLISPERHQDAPLDAARLLRRREEISAGLGRELGTIAVEIAQLDQPPSSVVCGAHDAARNQLVQRAACCARVRRKRLPRDLRSAGARAGAESCRRAVCVLRASTAQRLQMAGWSTSASGTSSMTGATTTVSVDVSGAMPNAATTPTAAGAANGSQRDATRRHLPASGQTESLFG